MSEGAVCLGSAFRDARKVTRAVERHLPNTPVVMVHNTLTFPRPNIYSVRAGEWAGIQSCVDYLTSRGRPAKCCWSSTKIVSAVR